MYHRTIIGNEMETEVDQILTKFFEKDFEKFRRLVVFMDGHFKAVGDLPLVIVYRSGQMEGFRERFNDCVAVCKMKRKGIKGWFKNRYSLQEAMTDGIMGTAQWNSYARHSLKFRARQLTIAQAFPDVLEGLGVDHHEAAKEVQETREESVREAIEQAQPSAMEEAREVLRREVLESGSEADAPKDGYLDTKAREKLLKEIAGVK